MLAKRISSAFNKTTYLIGKDKDNFLVWLEEAEWSCNWYWGFGYMVEYTNNKYPHRSGDIRSHSHFDGFLWGNDKTCEYENGKHIWKEPEYHYHINESNLLVETVLTTNESWELSDLMKRFYSLKETAEIFYKGSASLTSRNLDINKRPDLSKVINEEELPKIFAKTYKILSPD